MAAEKKENRTKAKTARKEVAPADALTEDFPRELAEPRWAVITFESSVAKGLTYDEAVQKMNELAAQGVSGLCVVTNEVAEKIKN